MPGISGYGNVILLHPYRVEDNSYACAAHDSDIGFTCFIIDSYSAGYGGNRDGMDHFAERIYIFVQFKYAYIVRVPIAHQQEFAVSCPRNYLRRFARFDQWY